MKLYTVQISNWRKAEKRGIPIKDVTVKSGDKRFAPTWDILMQYKQTNDKDLYTSRYIPLMRESYIENKKYWLELCNTEEIAIACYCKNGCFCHRYLMVDILQKICDYHNIIFEYCGEIV